MKKYIAVIFCHGIGSPRHYLTTANFIDALDVQGNTENPNELGFLRGLSSEVEMLDDGEASFRNYISFSRIQTVAGKDRPVSDYRVYEAYWADDHHKKSSICYALIWLIKAIWLSIWAVSSSWRSYPALRRRVLSQMTVNERLRRKIDKCYEEFDNANGRRNFPKGKFADFRDYIASLSDEAESRLLDELAVDWRSKFVKETGARFLRGLIVVLPLFAITFLAYATAFYLGTLLPINIFGYPTLNSYVPHLFSVFAVAALFFFGWRLIERLASDVIAWTTVHESQENFLVRERRVGLAQKLVRDVLANPDCSRCVLVGHSLGSSIILEAFQRQNAICRATNMTESQRKLAIASIKKVSHIFTIGSPIEKISRLFYADSGENHRYHKIKHSNPNRLDWPAWNTSGGPRLVNFWSRYDLISSRIFSLRTPENVAWKGVENVEVAPNGAPFPLASHSGYFKDAGTMSVIYQAIASGKISDLRLTHSKFKSQIAVKTKLLLTLLFVVSILGACAWLLQGAKNGWLQSSVLFLTFSSVLATLTVVRKDYRRHRKENIC